MVAVTDCIRIVNRRKWYRSSWMNVTLMMVKMMRILMLMVVSSRSCLRGSGGRNGGRCCGSMRYAMWYGLVKLSVGHIKLEIKNKMCGCEIPIRHEFDKIRIDRIKVGL